MSNVTDRITDRSEELQIVIRDPDPERILGGDGYINQRRRVEAQILWEALAPGDLDPVHIGDLLQYSGESRFDVVLLPGSSAATEPGQHRVKHDFTKARALRHPCEIQRPASLAIALRSLLRTKPFSSSREIVR